MLFYKDGYLQKSWPCLWAENLKFTIKDTKAENTSVVLERLGVRKRERERERERENYAKLRGSISSIHQSTDLCVPLRKIPGVGERFTHMNQREECLVLKLGQKESLLSLAGKPHGSQWQGCWLNTCKIFVSCGTWLALYWAYPRTSFKNCISNIYIFF